MIFAAQRLCDDIKLSVGRRFIVGGGHSAALISRLSTYHEYVAVAWRDTSEGGPARPPTSSSPPFPGLSAAVGRSLLLCIFLYCLKLPLIDVHRLTYFNGDIRNARGYLRHINVLNKLLVLQLANTTLAHG